MVVEAEGGLTGGLLNVIKVAMQTHPDSMDVQAHACSALVYIIRGMPESSAQIAEAEGGLTVELFPPYRSSSGTPSPQG